MMPTNQTCPSTALVERGRTLPISGKGQSGSDRMTYAYQFG